MTIYMDVKTYMKALQMWLKVQKAKRKAERVAITFVSLDFPLFLLKSYSRASALIEDCKPLRVL